MCFQPNPTLQVLLLRSSMINKFFFKTPSFKSFNMCIPFSTSAKCCWVCKLKVLLLKNNLFFLQHYKFCYSYLVRHIEAIFRGVLKRLFTQCNFLFWAHDFWRKIFNFFFIFQTMEKPQYATHQACLLFIFLISVRMLFFEDVVFYLLM